MTIPEYHFQLHYNDFGQLVLTSEEGIAWVGVEPIRCFPISDPKGWVSIVDAEGHELVCIHDPQKLPQELLIILQEELSRREFLPVVQQIIHVSTHADPTEWQVVTDRGKTTFFLDSEDEVRRLGPNSGVLIDTHGIRYLIPDIQKLDSNSRRIMSRYF